jgi:hypothetical protein
VFRAERKPTLAGDKMCCLLFGASTGTNDKQNISTKQSAYQNIYFIVRPLFVQNKYVPPTNNSPHPPRYSNAHPQSEGGRRKIYSLKPDWFLIGDTRQHVSDLRNSVSLQYHSTEWYFNDCVETQSRYFNMSGSGCNKSEYIVVYRLCFRSKFYLNGDNE